MARIKVIDVTEIGRGRTRYSVSLACGHLIWRSVYPPSSVNSCPKCVDGEDARAPLAPPVEFLPAYAPDTDSGFREGLRRFTARMMERIRKKRAEPEASCKAEIHHGAGHQSTTTCELTGPHDIHRAIYGSQRQEATWRGEKNVFSGYFDEAPEAEDEETE